MLQVRRVWKKIVVFDRRERHSDKHDTWNLLVLIQFDGLKNLMKTIYKTSLSLHQFLPQRHMFVAIFNTFMQKAAICLEENS